ncbi:hypothetical protein J9B83_07020 [Marinomonas sp. A79]|uniref:Uncharacterized protein n=1 Tax=Marinomonas vulgaris TaxID=2823372 RepID=A0ABS5HB60_9GAMM|nr:hypothetical protein [Marinomonas vulgaris]MBR7888692.1 hypothetical protein [Marinomonas vulgaris]
MNTQHSPFGAPRKELINGLQKGVVALLFVLLLASAGIYMLMSTDLEKQNTQQERLSALLGLVYSAEEHWLEWLLIDDEQIFADDITPGSASRLHQMLLSEYRLIDNYLSFFELEQEAGVDTSLALLNRLSTRQLDTVLLSAAERREMYSAFEHLKTVNNVLLQVGVDLDYQRQVFLSGLIWVPVAMFLLITFIVVLMTARFGRQLRSGFALLHYVLDHRRHGHAGILPARPMVDEFTDLSHTIDNELASRNYDLELQGDNLLLIDKALAKTNDAFIVTNRDGHVVWLSAGAERLWQKNSDVFESLLGIDSGLELPTGERIADEVLLSEQTHKMVLSDGVYWLTVKDFVCDDKDQEEAEIDTGSDNGPCLERFISIQTKVNFAEFDVLHHSLTLMEKDVWNTPIRMTRVDSPYYGFASSLETIRQKVNSVFEALSFVTNSSTSALKITKLQQIASLIDEKNQHNKSNLPDIVVQDESIEQVHDESVSIENASLADDLQAELNEMAWLSEQIRGSFLLGYELVLQRLALVEKDLSSDVFLLNDVDRCLNEVRAGVMTSLVATEGQSVEIRRRFAVDVEHDISLVQEQVEAMQTMAASTLSLLESDRSVGMARLDRARDSIHQMQERVESLVNKTMLSLIQDPSLAYPKKESDEQREES